MKVKLLKMAVVAGATAGFFVVCRLLEVPPLYLTAAFGWGLLCLFFSFELAGSRMSARHVIEEKTPLQRAWEIAGVVCIVSVCAFLFVWF